MKPFGYVLQTAFALACFGATCSLAAQQETPPFALHDGDRIAFYGDSITEQRLYTKFVEQYVRTRFPDWKTSFHNAGVGGDKVSGGWAGPIDERLDRDIFAWHPDVVTVMLGMNDFYYRADQPGIFSTYTRGYEHLVDALEKRNPHLNITLIQPSPYDDVTRDPGFPGGANSVLLKYGSFVADLAKQKHLDAVDFNAPVTAVLKAVNAESPALAKQIIPDRVHPGAAGHWIMAESLLKSWHAPSLVTSVDIDVASAASAKAENTTVSKLARSKGKVTSRIEWTQQDRALPLPLTNQALDPVLALALKNSDLVEVLDREILQVRSLTAGKYELNIDGRKVGVFGSDQLAAGINLATLESPMLEQARLVADDVDQLNELEAARFSVIAQSESDVNAPTAKALFSAYQSGIDQQRADAQPRPHKYELVLIDPAASR